MTNFNTIMAARTAKDGLPPFPDRPFPGDCGLDLVTAEDALVPPGGTANISCGVSVALPVGTFGWIVSRSSTWTRHGLIVIPGIIDEGWRGGLYTLIHRPWTEKMDLTMMRVRKGTRLAQLIVLPNLIADLKILEVDELPPGDRGENGFGSSGS
jgi:dUTP pyrophosphatase